MASDRFVKFSEADVKSLSEKQENANTKNKTSYNLKLFKEFLASKEEMRKLKNKVCARCIKKGKLMIKENHTVARTY